MKRIISIVSIVISLIATAHAHKWWLPDVDEVSTGIASCRVYSEPMGSAITNYPVSWWNEPIVTRVIGQTTNVSDYVDIDGSTVTVTNISDVVETVVYPYTILDGDALRSATDAERAAIDAASAAAEAQRIGALAVKYGVRVGALQAALQVFGMSIPTTYEDALEAIEALVAAGTLTGEQMAMIGSLEVIYKAANSVMTDDDIDAVFNLMNP